MRPLRLTTRLKGLALGLITAGSLAASPASADVIYSLNNPTGGPWGQVGLHQVQNSTNSVVVTVTLFNPPTQYFANAAGQAIAFNLNTPGTISFSNMTTGFIPIPGTTPGTGPYSASPFGNFMYGVCWTGDSKTGTTCGNGTAPPNSAGPLVFTVTDSDGSLSVADFAVLSTDKSNFTPAYFAVDVLATPASGGNAVTFNVGATGGGTVCDPLTQDCGGGRTQVPEPASLALLGVGLLGLGLVTQRRRVF